MPSYILKRVLNLLNCV